MTMNMTERAAISVRALQDNLARLFESGDFADVRFIVGGEEIAAHKGVLACHSTIFKNMFNGTQTGAPNQVTMGSSYKKSTHS